MGKTALTRLQQLAILLCSIATLAFADSPFGDPFVGAADRGDIAKIMQLVRSNYNVNTPGKFGSTALMRAVYHRNLKLVKVLLNAGANANSQDISGTTALHIAARQGYNDVINMLIENGAIVDVADHEGFTPLMRAVSANKLEATKVLLQHHADSTVVNKFNQSATKLAGNRSTHIKKLFGIKEAKPNVKAQEPSAPPVNKAISSSAAKVVETPLKSHLKVNASVQEKKDSSSTALVATNNKVRVGKAIKVEGELPKLAILPPADSEKNTHEIKPKAKTQPNIPQIGFYMYIKGFADEKAAVHFWYWVVSGAQFTGKKSKLMVNKVTTPPEPALRLAYYPAIKDIFKECRKIREQNHELYCYAVPVVLTK